jgi:phosphoglycerate dehydrogenase-like enzyme
MSRVAVTQVEYDKAWAVFAAAEGLECFSAPAGEVELASAIRSAGARHAIVGTKKYTGDLYAALPRGGVLARFGVGHDSIDKVLATEAGILVTNTPGVLDDSVAEHTLALILAAARRIPFLTSRTKAGGWPQQLGYELRNKTLAVIGCGHIGCRVAHMASFGLAMRVIGCEVLDVNLFHVGFTDVVRKFSQAVSEADFVSLHIPSTPQTHHFINRQRLEQLPSKAWLINTARGAVVDEAALFDALREGRIAGAALDVFETEPYLPVSLDKDLRTLENVIMTPHIASSTQEACNHMAKRAIENIRLAERGQYMEMDLLNEEVLAGLQ